MATNIEKVLGIPELAEMTLALLSPKDLLRLLRVNKLLNTTIKSSNVLRRTAFLKPGLLTAHKDYDEANPLLIDGLTYARPHDWTCRGFIVKDLPDAPKMMYNVDAGPDGKLSARVTIYRYAKGMFDMQTPKPDWQQHSYSRMEFWKSRVTSTKITVANPDGLQDVEGGRGGWDWIAVNVQGSVTVGQALEMGWSFLKAGQSLPPRTPELRNLEWDAQGGWAWQDSFEDENLVGLIQGHPQVQRVYLAK